MLLLTLRRVSIHSLITPPRSLMQISKRSKKSTTFAQFIGSFSPPCSHRRGDGAGGLIWAYACVLSETCWEIPACDQEESKQLFLTSALMNRDWVKIGGWIARFCIKVRKQAAGWWQHHRTARSKTLASSLLGCRKSKWLLPASSFLCPFEFRGWQDVGSVQQS